MPSVDLGRAPAQGTGCRSRMRGRRGRRVPGKSCGRRRRGRARRRPAWTPTRGRCSTRRRLCPPPHRRRIAAASADPARLALRAMRRALAVRRCADATRRAVRRRSGRPVAAHGWSSGAGSAGTGDDSTRRAVRAIRAVDQVTGGPATRRRPAGRCHCLARQADGGTPKSRPQISVPATVENADVRGSARWL